MPHSTVLRDKLVEGHNCTGSGHEFSVLWHPFSWLPAFLRLADIQREAELLQKMDHPNIAALALRVLTVFWNL